MIYLFLLQNLQGTTRLSKWFACPQLVLSSDGLQRTTEAEIHRVTARRPDDLSNAMSFSMTTSSSLSSSSFACKLLYRRYAGLVFSLLVDPEDNDLALLESVHLVVEILDAYFKCVSELDLVLNFAKVMLIVDEVYMAGEIQETSKDVVLQRLDLLRSVELDDVLELELEDLERLSGLCDTAFARRKKQRIEELAAKTLELEKQKQAELHYEPKITQLFASQPVKFNVGGSYFSTNLENHLKEAGTFFSVLFGGRWEPKINPDDKAMFIDRSPVMFGIILDYLRTGSIDLRDLSAVQLNAFKVEADFYQISSLLKQLPRPKFSKEAYGQVELSELDSIATNKQAGDVSRVLSLTPFSSNAMEMSIKVVKGVYLMIGVASRDILDDGASLQDCGWFMDTFAGELYGRGVSPGSVVTVKLDYKLNIRFCDNGKDGGVAYEKVAKDFITDPLFLCVQFQHNEDTTIIEEGVVKLV